MSFILDALRKSEHERQRQTGPALAEIPVATPRPRSNVWAPVVIALLLVNLVVVGVWLLRKSASEPEASPPEAAIVDPAPAPAGTGSAATSPAPTSMTGDAAAAEARQPPPMLRPAMPATSPVRQSRNPLEAETAGGQSMLDQQIAARAAAMPAGPAAVTRVPTSRGSVVYESLPDSAAVGGESNAPPPGASRQPTVTGTGLASADQLAALGIPVLNLDLHVYATRATDRLVFINSRKYREGDTMQEGPVVSQVTPTGVVLEYQGRSYLLDNN